MTVIPNSITVIGQGLLVQPSVQLLNYYYRSFAIISGAFLFHKLQGFQLEIIAISLKVQQKAESPFLDYISKEHKPGAI